jgi:predicted GH43/DUF377 family glycosyl hydrolase
MKKIICFSLSCFFLSCNSQFKIKTLEPWAFPHFKKADSINPILDPTKNLSFIDPITNTEVLWEERNVLNPTAIVKNDTVFMLYRAQDQWGTSRIGLAHSLDGLHFAKRATPVLYPKKDKEKKHEWNFRKKEGEPHSRDCISCYFDGVEDPRVVQTKNGSYLMTYTAYDGKTARLSIASSDDLINWTKHGVVLKGEKYKDYWSKAGAIVTEIIENQQVAKKINGKYWMYFGDTVLFMAYSQDLINWKPAINEENDKMISVLHPRKGYFDSRLVEPGPYALYKKNKGILLIYNASNASNFNDHKLPKYTYAAGQALFDETKPFKLIARTESYFIYPDKKYEKIGEVNEVCFVEGLVYFKDQWFLYYGTADSKIAVAVYKN